MDMDQNFQFLQTLLQLGWPAIVLVQCVVLWRDNIALRDKLFSYLENEEKSTKLPNPPTIHSGQD